MAWFSDGDGSFPGRPKRRGQDPPDPASPVEDLIWARRMLGRYVGPPTAPCERFDREGSRRSTRSVKDLAIATTKVTERVFAKAGSAAKDPSDAMRKMARKMATELDAARQQIENAFRDLK